MRILALDVGERRVGVVVSDPTQTLARSLLVLDRRRVTNVMERVGSLVQEQAVQREACPSAQPP